MLPQVLKAKYDKEIVRLTEETLSAELEFLFAGNDSIPYEKVTNSTISYYQLQKSIENGDIVVHYLVKSQVTKKYRTMIEPAVKTHLLEEAHRSEEHTSELQSRGH